MAKRLLIIGAGGHGRVIADTAALLGYETIHFIDQRWPELAQNLAWPVVGADVPKDLEGWSVAVAIGQNQARLKTLRDLQKQGVDLPNLIHPHATVSPFAKLGAAVFVGAQAVVGVGTHIGDGVIINTSASIDHDCALDSAVHISPGAHLAGTVRVGECSWIGIGAVVREGTEIGSNVVVGAGAAVVSNLPDGSKVGGVPARQMT
jgi:sugar O-acyltransferase (sialic acid O-acetyltransferase NeuD family)